MGWPQRKTICTYTTKRTYEYIVHSNTSRPLPAAATTAEKKKKKTMRKKSIWMKAKNKSINGLRCVFKATTGKHYTKRAQIPSEKSPSVVVVQKRNVICFIIMFYDRTENIFVKLYLFVYEL